MADTKWCPNCGAEYREGGDACTDCGVALVDEKPVEPEHEDGEVVVYELGDWTEEQRGELDQRLQGEGIPHQWETSEGEDTDPDLDPVDPWALGTDLVVGETDEEAVDRLLDDVEHPDELTAVGETEGDVDGEAAADEDEANYNVMSHLYVAADRLKDDPADLALAGEFFDAADAARGISVPFGIYLDVWNKVIELAGAISVALEEEAEDDVVRARAKELRDLLFTFV